MTAFERPGLESILRQRIMVLEGAMGTMIQAEKLSEADFRGDRFVAHESDLRGNNDLLNLTQPAVIAKIHGEFLAAGADIIETNTFNTTSVETVFDTLNCKAALFALELLFDEKGERRPVIVSGTVTDLTGRNLSGQTVTAFWYAVRHSNPLAFGLNCGFGGEQLRPFVEELAREIEVPLVAYPNAGLPNELGEYDEAAEMTGSFIREWAENGWVNMVGGCCGTMPEHLRAMREALESRPKGPRPTLDQISEQLGGFSSASDGTGDDANAPKRERRGRRG